MAKARKPPAHQAEPQSITNGAASGPQTPPTLHDVRLGDVELIPIDSVRQDPANANTHPDRNLDDIKRSLTRFGQRRPVGLHKTDPTIVFGNGTWLAAKALGWTHIAAERTSLEGAEATAYAIADNRTGETSEWNFPQLQAQLQAIVDAGLPDLTTAVGFNSKELDELAAGKWDGKWFVDPPTIIEDDVSSPPPVAITKPGDIWLLGDHRLLCGDSMCSDHVARLMDGATVDNVISDPPYGIDFNTDYRRFTSGHDVARTKHRRIANDDKPFDPSPFMGFKHVVLWGAQFFAQTLPQGTWLVWDKRFKDGTAFLSDAELAWMKGGYGVYIFSETSQGFVRPEPVQHPTQKPVSLMRWCIEKSKAAAAIFDPFAGSGTTLIAATQMNRPCYAMEIEPQWCDVVVARWEKLTGKKATLAT